MKMYIDLFFIFNVIMDYIIMSTNILLKRRTSYIRMILSSLIGGISSLVLFTSLNKIVIEIVSIVIMVLISFGYKGIRYLINNILYMYILSTLLGGIIYLFNIKVSNSMFLTYLIIIVISIEIMLLYIKENKKMRSIYNNYYKVDIYFKDREKLSLIGFVDTGNNLYDPYKKRPVIIVHNKYIKEDKYILVPYHTINGNGLLKCIKPDIIFIDGGKGQLNRALEVFHHLNVKWDKNRPHLIGVAKGVDRRAGQEVLIISKQDREIHLPDDSLALHLIQHIRDESHNHAISGHRQKRQKAFTQSGLETIEGVGAKRRQALLKYLGGLQGVKNATLDEIASVPGISKALAEKIFETLKS